MAEAKPSKDIQGSIVANLKKSVALHNYEVVEEPDRYLEDKECAVCKAEFGIIGIVHAKKCLCKFCGRGVCPKCSPEKLVHPNTRKEERICISCLSKMMENHLSLCHKDVKANKEEEKNNQKQILEIMIKEKQMDMSQNQYLEEQISLLKSTSNAKQSEFKQIINSLKDSHELIRIKHKMLKEDFEKFRQDREKKMSTLANLEKILNELRQVHEVNQTELPGLRNQVGELQETEIKLKNQIRTKHGLARSLSLSDKEMRLASEFEDLNHKNFVLTEENRIFKEEIQKLLNLNEEIASQIFSQETQASNRTNDSLISTTSTKYSPEEEDYIRTLREKSKENHLKIKNLRMQLESNNISFVKVKIDTENTAEPGSRPCANCSLM